MRALALAACAAAAAAATAATKPHVLMVIVDDCEYAHDAADTRRQPRARTTPW